MDFKVKGENGKDLSDNRVRYIMFAVTRTYGEDNLTILKEVWNPFRKKRNNRSEK